MSPPRSMHVLAHLHEQPWEAHFRYSSFGQVFTFAVHAAVAQRSSGRRHASLHAPVVAAQPRRHASSLHAALHVPQVSAHSEPHAPHVFAQSWRHSCIRLKHGSYAHDWSKGSLQLSGLGSPS